MPHILPIFQPSCHQPLKMIPEFPSFSLRSMPLEFLQDDFNKSIIACKDTWSRRLWANSTKTTFISVFKSKHLEKHRCLITICVTRSIDITSACSSFLTAGHETKEFHQILNISIKCNSRPSHSARHLVLCNRVNLSGCGWPKPDQTSLI